MSRAECSPKYKRKLRRQEKVDDSYVTVPSFQTTTSTIADVVYANDGSRQVEKIQENQQKDMLLASAAETEPATAAGLREKWQFPEVSSGALNPSSHDFVHLFLELDYASADCFA